MLALSMDVELSRQAADCGVRVRVAATSHPGPQLIDNTPLIINCSQYGSGLFISSLILGSMSDTYGRARVILWALSGTAAAYFGQAVAWSFPVLVSFRFIGGLFSGTRPVLLAYLADTVTPTAMPFYSSLIGLCVAASQCLASGAGGALATISLQTPLWVSCTVTALTAILVGLWLQEPIPDASSSSSPSVVGLRQLNRTYESGETLDDDDGCRVPTSAAAAAATPPQTAGLQGDRNITVGVGRRRRRTGHRKTIDDYMKSYEWCSVFVCSIVLGATIQFNFSSWITLLPLLCGVTWNLTSDITGYILASQGIVTIVSNLLVFIPITRCLNIATVASLGGLCHSLILGVAYLQHHIGPTIALGNTLTLAALPVVSKIIAPMHKRGFVNAVVMSTQNLSMVIGPLLGGYMLDMDPSHKLPYIVMCGNGLLGLLAGIFIRTNIDKVEASLKRLDGSESPTPRSLRACAVP
ncbi:hypothetical protein FOZ61_008816 [Perkinsus olseni]|uniref:Major facilitator superfamily (MFS) profile domain-containing protein n=1 Tax=Perkinsus olseni TaxID=32597 RepID=A0A7J6MGN7_PEROL|nr:hypothetical protein FOZ61_008816 [Perkinsus olseni]